MFPPHPPMTATYLLCSFKQWMQLCNFYYSQQQKKKKTTQTNQTFFTDIFSVTSLEREGKKKQTVQFFCKYHQKKRKNEQQSVLKNSRQLECKEIIASGLAVTDQH